MEDSKHYGFSLCFVKLFMFKTILCFRVWKDELAFQRFDKNSDISPEKDKTNLDGRLIRHQFTNSSGTSSNNRPGPTFLTRENETKHLISPEVNNASQPIINCPKKVG